jgi:ABC-2 type transport system permease protein
MRWPRIARKDFRDAARTRSLLVTLAIFVLVGGLQGYLSTTTDDPSTLAQTLPVVAIGGLTLLVPIVALGLSYESIVGPRTSGTLQFLLGLPYSRADYALGTYVGRAALVTAGIFSGFVALALTAAVRGIVVSPTKTLQAFLLAATLGVVFVAIGVTISLSVRSTSTAGALAFAAFLVLFFFWSSLPGALAFVLNGFSTPATLPEWAPYVRSLNPVAAFQVLVDQYLTGPNTSVGGFGGGGVDSPALAIGVLLTWIAVVPAAAYRRFSDCDL